VHSGRSNAFAVSLSSREPCNAAAGVGLAAGAIALRSLLPSAQHARAVIEWRAEPAQRTDLDAMLACDHATPRPRRTRSNCLRFQVSKRQPSAIVAQFWRPASIHRARLLPVQSGSLSRAQSWRTASIPSQQTKAFFYYSSEHTVEHLLPSEDEADALLDCLSRVAEEGGASALLSTHIVEPTRRYFPDDWKPSHRNVELLAKRLLAYAGMDDFDVVVDPEGGSDDEDECKLRQSGLPVWFVGMSERCCMLAVDDKRLEDHAAVTAALCHALAHAFRAHFRASFPETTKSTYREQPRPVRATPQLEERLTDVTAVAIGFGILAANASHQQRTSSRLVGSSVTWKMTTLQVGTLGPHGASFLLAAQAVLRGLSAKRRREIAAQLETNQAAFFEAACSRFESGGAEALRSRLSIPAQVKASTPPDLDDLKRGLGHEAAALMAAAEEEEEEDPPSKPKRPAIRLDTNMAVFSSLTLAAGAFALVAHNVDSTALALLIVALAAALGVVIGRRWILAECAVCGLKVGTDAKECSRCGGPFVGTVKRRHDYLGALEAYEVERRREQKAKRRRKR